MEEWRCCASVPEKNALRETLGALIKQAHSHGTKAEKTLKSVISLGQGDPSGFACFKPPPIAEEALGRSATKSLFNGYPPPSGLPDARRAVAEYLCEGAELPFKPTLNDVYLTVGCTQAIQICLTVLGGSASPNILLPRPGFPLYQTVAAQNALEVRFYDLMPEKNWEANLEQIEQLADERTVSLVVINPNNPCGSVFSYQHCLEIAKTAGKLKVPIISDEVYAHIVYRKCSKFVPMATFATYAPVLTLGGLSKRWMMPGWRLGWLITSDPNGILQRGRLPEAVEALMNIWSGPSTLIQAAVPSILKETSEEFYKRTLDLLETAANICCDRIKKIEALSCYSKPQGSMFIMVKINVYALEDISDDMQFCWHLAREEAVVALPGKRFHRLHWKRDYSRSNMLFLQDLWSG
eukprot:TRINITY_DN3558_c0_g1_i2.p1 TRINITY_DN3558_c0_g1~~TRINITY_DN3558_c0_g1_i2.p1  ORF type:complete len:409 (-),score=70.46 TRINITY_DN3558_c0_g1_i2:326-1552(-)